MTKALIGLLRGLSVVLLVKLEEGTALYRVNTFRKASDPATPPAFKAWKDYLGADLYWKGHRVSRVYSCEASTEVWREVPIIAAIDALIKRGDALLITRRPEKEELPQ